MGGVQFCFWSLGISYRFEGFIFMGQEIVEILLCGWNYRLEYIQKEFRTTWGRLRRVFIFSYWSTKFFPASVKPYWSLGCGYTICKGLWTCVEMWAMLCNLRRKCRCRMMVDETWVPRASPSENFFFIGWVDTWTLHVSTLLIEDNQDRYIWKLFLYISFTLLKSMVSRVSREILWIASYACFAFS